MTEDRMLDLIELAALRTRDQLAAEDLVGNAAGLVAFRKFADEIAILRGKLTAEQLAPPARSLIGLI